VEVNRTSNQRGLQKLLGGLLSMKAERVVVDIAIAKQPSNTSSS